MAARPFAKQGANVASLPAEPAKSANLKKVLEKSTSSGKHIAN
ncbi:MAG: pyoverdine/dityrosine biosynthesis protein Dit1 [Sulfitobacter sp.]|jgi:pyoverdine/dityrosine biosynthesis protein Dit1